METFETEDQQVEAIKKWWRENYKIVVFAIVAGLAAILGSQYYMENKIMMAETASDHFNEVLKARANDQLAIIADRSELLQKDFSSTPYAAQATMIWASALAQQGELEKARQKLDWVIAHTRDPVNSKIAVIHQAQLLFDSKNYQQAHDLLTANYHDEDVFAALNLETQGDILVAMGKMDEAVKSYDKALAKYLTLGINVEFLKIKRNDISPSL